MAKIEVTLVEKGQGKAAMGKGWPFPNRSENRNILKLPKIQSFFSTMVLCVTKAPLPSSNLRFAVCYHDTIKSNATSDGNRYSFPDVSFSKVFQQAEGKGFPS